MHAHVACLPACLPADQGICPSDHGTVPNLIFVNPLGLAQSSFSDAFAYSGLQALSNTTITISPQSQSQYGSGSGSTSATSATAVGTTGSGSSAQAVSLISTSGLPANAPSSSLLTAIMGSSYSSTPFVHTPPTIQLLTTRLLGGTVMVRQGTPYRACSPGQEPSDTIPCELGASASDAHGGSLSPKVLACAPANCTSPSVCPAFAFALNGIAACAVNTSAPVGTVIDVAFTVYDSSSSPPLATSVSRTVVVRSACDLPLKSCNGQCVEVACEAFAILEATYGPLTTGPPLFTFGPQASSQSGSGGGMSPAAGRRRLRGSEDPQQRPGASTSINTRQHRRLQQAASGSKAGLETYVTYGLLPDVSLAPCGQDFDTCGVTATDYLHNDLSSNILVLDATPGCDQQGSGCIFCSPLLLEAALCMPGNYTFQYLVTDSAGRNASHDVYVQVELRARYSLSFGAVVSCGLLDSSSSPDGGSLAASYEAFVSSYYLPLLLGAAGAYRLRNSTLSSSHLAQVPGSSPAVCQLDSSWDVTVACSPSEGSNSNSNNSTCPCPVSWVSVSPPSTVVAPQGTFGPLLSFSTSSCTAESKPLDPLLLYPAAIQTMLSSMRLKAASELNMLSLMATLTRLSGLYDARDAETAAAWEHLMADDRAYEARNLANITTNLAIAVLGTKLSDLYQGSLSLKQTAPAVNASEQDAALSALVVARGTTFSFMLSKYSADTQQAGRRSLAASTTQQPSSVVSRKRVVGTRNNVVLGGLLMQQTRLSQLDQTAGSAATLRRCAGRFVPLDPLCDYMLTPEAQREITALAVESSGHAGPEPVGTDPFMVNTSLLYQPNLAAYPQDWYNTSSGALQMSPTGAPYGFFYEPLGGGPEPGYPLLLEINVSEDRASLLWAFVQQGHYLYSAYTQKLVVRVAAFNVGMRALALWQGSFSWAMSGGIQATFGLRVLPYRDYTASGLQQPGQLSSLALDLALLALVLLYCAQTGVDLVLSIRASRKVNQGAEGDAGVNTHLDLLEEAMNRWSKKMKREGRKLRHTPIGYRPVTSKAHMVMELFVCGLMATSMYLLFMSATSVSTKVPTDPRIVVYDASLFAPCRPFMLLKQEPAAAPATTTSIANGSSTSPPPPDNFTGNSSSGGSPSTPPRRLLQSSAGSSSLTAAEVIYINAAAAAAAAAASNASLEGATGSGGWSGVWGGGGRIGEGGEGGRGVRGSVIRQHLMPPPPDPTSCSLMPTWPTLLVPDAYCLLHMPPLSLPLPPPPPPTPAKHSTPTSGL